MNDSRDPPWTLETVATKPAAMTTRFLLLNHFFLKQLQKHIFKSAKKEAKKETKERKRRKVMSVLDFQTIKLVGYYTSLRFFMKMI